MSEQREDVELPPDEGGMTALPPGPHLVFEAPKPPTPTEMVQHLAYWLVMNVLGLVVAAAIVSFAWNALQSLHLLSTIDFHQAFALLVILRVLAFTVRY